MDINQLESVLEDMGGLNNINGEQLLNDIMESLSKTLPNSSTLLLGIGTLAILGAMTCTFSKLIRLQYQYYTGNPLTFYNSKNPIPTYKPTGNETEEAPNSKFSKKK